IGSVISILRSEIVGWVELLRTYRRPVSVAPLGFAVTQSSYAAEKERAMARKITKQTAAKHTNRRVLDPVITEIVRNGVIAVTEEMKTNLMRTAYNMIIYEALDFTVGLFTPDGETVSIGIGLPMFIRGMAETVKAKIRHFGKVGIRPGDIYVTNDAYITGSH